MRPGVNEETHILARHRFEQVKAFVRAAVIDRKELKIAEGLVENRLHRGAQEARGVVYRHHDGDAGQSGH
jgi:hypothetical protein